MHSMTVVKRLWILLFTVLSVAVHGEQVYFQNLTTDMGLSHGDVISSLIDSEGYIWAGTVDGLNKYDGTSFTIYKQVAGDSTSLPSNYINCIYEDSHNNLWLGTNGFLVRYNRDKDNFERIPLAYGTAVIDVCCEPADSRLEDCLSLEKVDSKNKSQTWKREEWDGKRNTISIMTG